MFKGLISISILALSLVACTRSSSQNQPLFIYTTMDEPIVRQIVAAYEKETGEEVEFVRLSTGEAAARIETEKNNPQASLWLGGVGLSHVQIKQKGLTAAYQHTSWNKIPAALKDGDGYWSGLYMGVLSFASNSKQLKRLGLKKPTSWIDLLDKKLEGQVQISNPGSSGTSYNLIAALIVQDGETGAFDYFKKLNHNISQYTRSGSAPAKNVAIGEATIAVGYAHDIVRLIHDDKAPLELSFPKEGTGYEIASISLIKDGKQLEKAKKFYDWMYSPTASQVMADYYFVPIVSEGIQLKADSINPKDIKLINVDLEWAGKERDRLINLWNEKING
ncbi:MAG: iron ABC transporter substrate-binding protein [Deltaproteobacteria bacterium CG11_big_fil_rev_8_21_14_0_20_45_16]|nr:MAG: iron ABC transporter substrate-binding protein [Deltaproteobacteria bacterium CG11_big_fil_rev_8_21_14_0_20_45_16]